MQHVRIYFQLIPINPFDSSQERRTSSWKAITWAWNELIWGKIWAQWGQWNLGQIRFVTEGRGRDHIGIGCKLFQCTGNLKPLNHWTIGLTIWGIFLKVEHFLLFRLAGKMKIWRNLWRRHDDSSASPVAGRLGVPPLDEGRQPLGEVDVRGVLVQSGHAAQCLPTQPAQRFHWGGGHVGHWAKYGGDWNYAGPRSVWYDDLVQLQAEEVVAHVGVWLDQLVSGLLDRLLCPASLTVGRHPPPEPVDSALYNLRHPRLDFNK